MEEEEPEVHPVFGQSMPQESFASNVGQVGVGSSVAMGDFPENEERAIVLFKPMNSPLLQSPQESFASNVGQILKNARKLGDFLLVGIYSDQNVRNAMSIRKRVRRNITNRKIYLWKLRILG